MIWTRKRKIPGWATFGLTDNDSGKALEQTKEQAGIEARSGHILVVLNRRL